MPALLASRAGFAAKTGKASLGFPQSTPPCQAGFRLPPCGDLHRPSDPAAGAAVPCGPALPAAPIRTPFRDRASPVNGFAAVPGSSARPLPDRMHRCIRVRLRTAPRGIPAQLRLSPKYGRRGSARDRLWRPICPLGLANLAVGKGSRIPAISARGIHGRLGHPGFAGMVFEVRLLRQRDGRCGMATARRRDSAAGARPSGQPSSGTGRSRRRGWRRCRRTIRSASLRSSLPP